MQIAIRVEVTSVGRPSGVFRILPDFVKRWFTWRTKKTAHHSFSFDGNPREIVVAGVPFRFVRQNSELIVYAWDTPVSTFIVDGLSKIVPFRVSAFGLTAVGNISLTY